MTQEVVLVRFQGRRYLLIGSLTAGGPIATREAYRHGRCSYAQLYPDGHISRFGTTIGTVADLKVLGVTTVPTIADDAFDNMIADESWPERTRNKAMTMLMERLLERLRQ